METEDGHSVFDGFEEYRSWSPEDIIDALRNGLVVLDANILLDLYRFDPGVRDSLIAILTDIQQCLFFPHQVVLEFWTNRESALVDRVRTAQSVAEKLGASAGDLESSINRWRNRSGGSIDSEVEDWLETALTALEQIAESIERAAGRSTHSQSTFNDDVLSSIERLATGRVGHRPDAELRTEWVAEGLRRVNEKIPPGYKDGGKDGDAAAGDFLVWKQMLEEAGRRNAKRVVLVTSDQKEDWVRIVNGERRGARLELRREALDSCGADFAVLSVVGLLRIAAQWLQIDVDKDTVDRLSTAIANSERDWDTDNVREFLELLAAEDRERHAVVMAAVANGGEVDRETVYALCSYPSERTLRGFTRPTSRIKRELVRRGSLSESAEEPLTAVYTDPDSYVLASGFRLPASFRATASQIQDD